MSDIKKAIEKYVDRRLVIMSLVVVLFGIGLFAYDYYTVTSGFKGSLDRPGISEQAWDKSVYMEKDGKKEEVDVHISPQEPDSKEAKVYLDEASEEIEKTYLGKNKSPDKVSEALDLRSSYSEGFVKAEWSFSDGRYINSDGTLIYEEIEKADEAVIITLRASLSCGEEAQVVELPVELHTADVKSTSGFAYYLDKALKESDEKNPSKAYIKLPDEIGGISLKWSKEADNRGLLIALLGITACVGVALGRREDERRRQAQRQRELTKDYPMIVSMLSLYVSAGVTVRSAFKRIFTSYMQERKRAGPAKRPGYESIGVILRKMEDGVGELEAYSQLGRITENENYLKLSMLLTKNIRHGQSNLAALLEKEEADAFMQRKQRARKLGEEASTKLLAPMILLLGVVLVIMIAPAMFALKM